MPDGDRKLGGMETRAATFEPSSYDPATREIDLVWSTGADVMRMDWRTGGTYVERLSMEPKAIRLERLNSGASLLDSHMGHELRNVIGAVVPGTARIEKGMGIARVRLSAAADVADAVTKITEGVVRNVSVGYGVAKWDVTPGKDGKPEVRTATDWEPHEISMVPVPADARAQTRSAEIAQSAEVAQTEPETPAQERVMSEQTPVIDLDAVRREAQAAERKRADEISNIAKRHGVDLSAAIAEGKTVEQARAMALDALAAKQDAAPTSNTHGTGIRVISDAQETRRRGLEQAMEHSTGGIAGSALDIGRPFAGRSLPEMCRSYLVASGVAGAQDMSRDEVFRSLSTSDFSSALANVLNKRLLNAYAKAPQNWQLWTERMTFNDYRPHSIVGIADGPALDLVVEGGTFTEGTFRDKAESIQAFQYGKIVRFTEQVFVNDDLGAVMRSVDRWATKAGIKVNQLCVAVLTANANLAEDGNPLFGATHTYGTSNLVTSGAAPSSLANIQASIDLLDAQTDLGGDKINVAAKYILVPAPLYMGAAQALGLLPQAQVTAANLVTPEYSEIVLIKERELSGAPWYMFADPALAPVVAAGYLAGREGPRLVTEESFNTAGVAYRMDITFGAGAVDFRGAVKNAGQ